MLFWDCQQPCLSGLLSQLCWLFLCNLTHSFNKVFTRRLWKAIRKPIRSLWKDIWLQRPFQLTPALVQTFPAPSLGFCCGLMNFCDICNFHRHKQVEWYCLEERKRNLALLNAFKIYLHLQMVLGEFKIRGLDAALSINNSFLCSSYLLPACRDWHRAVIKINALHTPLTAQVQTTAWKGSAQWRLQPLEQNKYMRVN